MAFHDQSVKTSDDARKTPPAGSAARSNPDDWMLLLWMRRSVLKSAVICGVAFSTTTAFLLPDYYISSARVMPPASDVTIAAGAHIARLSPALLVDVMYSTTVEDEIIDRFHLMEVYGSRLRQDARDELESNTEIVEDRPSALITISVRDHSPQRASEMVKGYITGLNRRLAQVNTSAAHKERIFIEERINETRKRLNESAREFSEFSSKNAAINVTEQSKVLLKGSAHLQGQLIAARSDLAGLEQIYAPSHARMRELRARTVDLEKQLLEMTKGEGRQPYPQKADAFVYPSIQKLPLLAREYFALLRQRTIHESILEVLSEEYEMAKLEETKDLPFVRIIDQPMIPEKKAGPLRVVIVLCGMLLSIVFSTAWILATSFWMKNNLDPLFRRKATVLPFIYRNTNCPTCLLLQHRHVPEGKDSGRRAS